MAQKKWIGRGVLKVGGKKFLKYGENIPKNFNKERLKKLIKDGVIGEIIEPVKPVEEKEPS